MSSGIVSSICKTLEIPHIITHWTQAPIGSKSKSSMTLNVFPDAEVLARAFADLIVDYSWKSYTIIYDEDDSLIKLKDVLQIHNPNDNPITVRQLDDGPDYRPMLKEIQSSGESHIVLDIHPDKIVDLLRQARDVKMMEEYQSYIITSLDTHTIDFEELKFLRANITSLRLIDPQSFEVKNAVHDWEQGENQQGRPFRISPEHVQVARICINSLNRTEMLLFDRPSLPSITMQ